jgi:hypothetical protein
LLACGLRMGGIGDREEMDAWRSEDEICTLYSLMIVKYRNCTVHDVAYPRGAHARGRLCRKAMHSTLLHTNILSVQAFCASAERRIVVIAWMCSRICCVCSNFGMCARIASPGQAREQALRILRGLFRSSCAGVGSVDFLSLPPSSFKHRFHVEDDMCCDLPGRCTLCGRAACKRRKCVGA